MAFKIFDADNNGVITVEELKQVFAWGSANDKTEGVWNDIMNSVDTN